jgi:two-component system C4-dicarboxylate transport response regulator DctD
MKGMNGLEVLARLCAISPQTHVIVITGHEDAAARITAMQIGTVAFFIKPFNDEEFLEAVHRALGHTPKFVIQGSIIVGTLIGCAFRLAL